MTKNPYHLFLLKHRVYCELCSYPNPATRVCKVRKRPAWPETKDTCVCDAHYRVHTPLETGYRRKEQMS